MSSSSLAWQKNLSPLVNKHRMDKVGFLGKSKQCFLFQSNIPFFLLTLSYIIRWKEAPLSQSCHVRRFVCGFKLGVRAFFFHMFHQSRPYVFIHPTYTAASSQSKGASLFIRSSNFDHLGLFRSCPLLYW